MGCRVGPFRGSSDRCRGARHPCGLADLDLPDARRGRTVGGRLGRGAQRLLGEAFERWGLVADGPLRTGWTAVVVPVLREGERWP